jgi:hypothetical protein
VGTPACNGLFGFANEFELRYTHNALTQQPERQFACLLNKFTSHLSRKPPNPLIHPTLNIPYFLLQIMEQTNLAKTPKTNNGFLKKNPNKNTQDKQMDFKNKTLTKTPNTNNGFFKKNPNKNTQDKQWIFLKKP